MKKRVIGATLASLTFGGLLFATSTSATEVSHGETDVQIGFLEDDHHPEDPGDDGQLQLTWAPNLFDFKMNNALPTTTGQQTYTEQVFTGQGKNAYVVVRDDRPESQSATRSWKLKAILGDLIDPNGKKLADAKINLQHNIKGYVHNFPTVPDQGPTVQPANVLTYSGTAIVLPTPQGTQLPADGTSSVELMKTTDSTEGRQSNALEMNSILMTVPADSITANGHTTYTSKITWSLDDTL
ncbi:MAG: WxL domain-containing protein [Lactobacillales bacterium]|jgi:hypothetical protein|nr:WxL domain-containing protein [Lactobacillales bacterium]